MNTKGRDVESENHSTHEMVTGLHRRFDGFDDWRNKIDDRVVKIEQVTSDMLTRTAVMEEKIKSDRVANDRMYEQFSGSFSRLEDKIDTTTKSISDYAETESTNRQKLLWGFIGIGVVAVLNLIVLLINATNLQ